MTLVKRESLKYYLNKHLKVFDIKCTSEIKSFDGKKKKISMCIHYRINAYFNNQIHLNKGLREN